VKGNGNVEVSGLRSIRIPSTYREAACPALYVTAKKYHRFGTAFQRNFFDHCAWELTPNPKSES
jgi:hypothetical protein